MIELIKDVQNQYMNQGKIETRIYENLIKSYSSKLSEVDENLAFLDAQDAMKKGDVIVKKVKLGEIK